MSIPKPQSPPSQTDIIHMMEDFDNSESVTVKEFCEIHDIDATTFREWHRIFENRKEKDRGSGFIPLEVQIPKDGQSRPSPLFAEVQGIRLYREVPPDYLKALLP